MSSPAPFLRWAGGKRQLLPALTAALPAAGLGGDAYITTQDGLTIVVEVTGVEGDRQISHELEPATRHLRDRLAREGEAVVLFVAPKISERFLAHWLGVAAFEDPSRPAMVVPVTEGQLRTIAEARADLVGICRQVVAETERIAAASLATHRMAWPGHAARELLAEIQRIVDDAVSASR